MLGWARMFSLELNNNYKERFEEKMQIELLRFRTTEKTYHRFISFNVLWNSSS